MINLKVMDRVLICGLAAGRLYVELIVLTVVMCVFHSNYNHISKINSANGVW